MSESEAMRLLRSGILAMSSRTRVAWANEVRSFLTESAAQKWAEQCKSVQVVGKVTWHCQRKIHDDDSHFFGIPAHLAPQAGVQQIESIPFNREGWHYKAFMQAELGQSKELSDLLDDYRKQIVREMAGQPCAPSEVRAEILSRFAPASHTLRCPKCGGESDAEGRQSPLGNFVGTGREGIQIDEEQE